MWDLLQYIVTSPSEPLEAFAAPNAPASVMASVFLYFIYSSDFFIYFIYTFSIYSNSFSIYCSSIRRPFTPTPSPFTAPPLTSLTHLYQHTIISNFCLFFYCSDLSLVPFFHKLLLTQHKARGRRRSPSQKQAHPDTSNTGADTGLRIRPLPR